MKIPFRKMHGAGNDFVVVDARAGALPLTPARIAALAHRRTGIGCDQFITLESPPADMHAEVFMRIHNPDGSEAGACGNATRCVAAVVAQETGRRDLVIATISGALPAIVGASSITVDMGAPLLGWRDIPLAYEADTLLLPVEGGPAACSMGNPHATLFVDDIAAVPVAERGAALERDAIFPQRANIGFAQVLGPELIRLRVWERAAGLTLACGSGACAALVNAVRRGLTSRRAELRLDGGTLLIEWRADGHVTMQGPAVLSFEGVVDLGAYPG
jgi:diaminopimelate epimerase